MGSFFTNVQVYSANHDGEASRIKVTEAVRRIILRDSFVETSNDEDEPPDRVVLVGPSGPEPWIAVYDEATENQDSQRLKRLATQLSAEVNNFALGVLVHDSDILLLHLAQSGQHVDTFDSAPDYFRSRPTGRRRAYVGQPERWRAVLRPDASPEQLRAAWVAEDTFADDKLARISPLLGLDPDRASTGYEYLSRGDLDLAGFTRLTFRSQGAPAIQYAKGLPRLERAGGVANSKLVVGTEFGSGMQTISATARSVGGSSQGLHLVVWGDALDRGLIDLDGAVVVRRDKTTGLPVSEEVAFERRSDGGISHWFADLPHYEIPQGLSAGSDLSSLFLGSIGRRGMDAVIDTCITANLRGIARAPGRGKLHIGFAPLANYQAGQTSWTIEVDVEATEADERG